MKAFEGGAPVRLVLPWMPPVTYEDTTLWESVLANDVDTPEVRNVLGHFDQCEIVGDEIHFFMFTTRRRSDLKKLMRLDKDWRRFVKDYPDLRIEWAEDVLKDTP
jgi:hypothetical protein